MSEKRKFRRFTIDQLVNLTFSKHEEFVPVTGLNISEAGILCEAASSMNNYDKVYLMLTDPISSDTIELEGIVVRSEKNGNAYYLGIAFVELSADQKTKIKKYINHIAKS